MPACELVRSCNCAPLWAWLLARVTRVPAAIHTQRLLQHALRNPVQQGWFAAPTLSVVVRTVGIAVVAPPREAGIDPGRIIAMAKAAKFAAWAVLFKQFSRTDATVMVNFCMKEKHNTSGSHPHLQRGDGFPRKPEPVL